jgi:CRP-like cAMP-binding protein
VAVKHRDIAQNLGSTREVVSRTIRKLEIEGCIRQTDEEVEIL